MLGAEVESYDSLDLQIFGVEVKIRVSQVPLTSKINPSQGIYISFFLSPPLCLVRWVELSEVKIYHSSWY